jgi:repressor LexA
VLRHNPLMAFEFDRDLVREEMSRRGIKQAQLARELGFPAQSYIAKILSGDRQVKADEASRIYARLQLLPGGAEPVREVPIVGLTNAGAWREAIEMPHRTMFAPRKDMGAKIFAIEVKGDSMDLLIEEGGYIIVDPDQTNLYDGKIYLIENHEYETTVKRYRGNPARFCPMSRNPEHQEFTLGSGHYRVIGRVIYKGGEVE